MREWEERGSMDDAEKWDMAYGRVLLARRVYPLNADSSADLGRLMEWQSWRQLPGSVESLKYRGRASRFYVETIGKRPSWGLAWALYAENQLLSGDRGSEFLAALEKAIVLAPWEPGVQRKVAWLGMSSWDELPVSLRVVVESSIRRSVALETNLNELVRVAIQYDWLDRLRPMMRTDRQRAALELVLKQMGQR